MANSTHTPEYRSWIGMRARCHSKRSTQYKWYGARGIKVCSKWRYSFKAFLADVGLKPSSQHSLDRINNNKGYSPSNVRWATKREQMLNTRHNKIIEYRGVRMPMIKLAELTNVKYMLLYKRIVMRKWPVEKAVFTPAADVKPSLVAYRGSTKSISAWARKLGFPAFILATRLGRGWTVTRAFTTPIQKKGSVKC
jgi:hypothetical protein